MKVVLNNYDNTNIESIINYANKLVGKTIKDVLNTSKDKVEVNIKNKGSIGTLLEKYWFGIEPNSSPLPDFDKVGVELKIIPLIKQKTKISVKERTKVCSIDYKKLIHETWDKSHVKEKLNKVLFIYYLYDKDDILQSKIYKIDLWKLNENNNEFIIKIDWLNVQKKVCDGYAHELSESISKVLSASRSGSGGKDKFGKEKDLVIQPNQIFEKEALKRAFSLKQSFTNQRWNELKKVKYESIIDSLDIQDFNKFETAILNKINSFENKSLNELSDIFDLDLTNRSKNKEATIVKKAIGFNSVKSKIKEFEQLGIIVKTINVNKNSNMPFEGISFPAMKLIEFEEEVWEESTFKGMINKILFIPIYKYKKDVGLEEKYLGKSFFWTPSEDEKLIENEWMKYQQEVIEGKAKVTKVSNNSKRGYKEITELSKESETEIIHIRPHGRDADDRDIDSLGNSLVKQSFWFNKKFMQKLLVKTQF
jgi:DNA mismatch repair endonuclease MutH